MEEERTSSKLTLTSEDPQWGTEIYVIFNKNTKVANAMMQIVKGKVNCRGSESSMAAAKFKVYQGVVGGKLAAMLQCINSGLMVCVDNQGCLSTKKVYNEYVNYHEGGKDALFYLEMVGSTSSYLRFKHEEGYMGFDRQGQPIPLKDVDESSDAAKFIMHS